MTQQNNSNTMDDNFLYAKKLWRRNDVANALGIGLRLAEKLMRTNAIRSAMLGKARVTTPEHVEAYIKTIIFSQDNEQ